MKTLSLTEAADFLKMHAEEVRRRAKSGLLPGAKLGKRWVFILDDLADYLRSHYANPRQALRVVSQKEVESCRSINVVTRGGLASLHQQESVLDVLLRQATKPKQQELHDKLKAESWRIAELGDKPKRTWDEAAYQFLIEAQHKATHDRHKEKPRWLQHFLRNKPLDEVDRELVNR